MKKFTVFTVLLLVLQLVWPISMTGHAEEKNDSLNYLALGDSLAAGVNEQNQLGLGYADFIAKNFQELENDLVFNKGFAYPGYTTVDVLNDIEANVIKPIYDLNGMSKTTINIQDAIKQADLITLSIGANDVLKNVNRGETGEISFNMAGVLKGIQDVAANYEKIFGSIDKINPDADVLVMGLYNPFPHIQDPAIQTQINLLVTTMNNAIRTIVDKKGGIFSEVAPVIKADAKTYLPNPANIHLSEAGYQAVAKAMFDNYMDVLIKELEGEVAEEKPREAPFSDTKDHWGKEYIDIVYASGFMDGFEDGTFRPNMKMTRAQVISSISRAFNLTAAQKAPFKDIGHFDEQMQNEIAAAFEAGLVRENNGQFNPQGNVTRAQLSLILMRLSSSILGQQYEPVESTPFRDISGYDSEAQTAITLLYGLGVVQGTGADTFSPKGNVTRAQLAKILVQILSKQ